MKHKIITGDEILPIIEKHYKGVNEIYLCSPYLKLSTIEAIFKILQDKSVIRLKIITRYDPMDLLLGSTDKSVFDLIFKKENYCKWQIDVYIVNNLHTKAILLGVQTAIIGSANLTYSGLNRNVEMGIALFNGDSKILTIREQLKSYCENGYKLTPEHFAWYCQHDLPRFEKKANALKSIVNKLKIERDAGLQSFVPGTKKTKGIDYFNGVMEVLRFIKTAVPATREKVLQRLRDVSKKDGDKINDSRLEFLFNLGLIYEDEAGLHLTGASRLLMAASHKKQEFYKHLAGAYPEFERLYQFIKDNQQVSPDDLENAKNMNGKAQYWAIRLRWMESLDIIAGNRIKKKKYYRLKEQS